MTPLNKKLATKFRAFARANLPYHYAKRFNKRLFEAGEVMDYQEDEIENDNFLVRAFSWDNTKEGHDFWYRVNCSVNNSKLALPPLPPL